MGRCGSLQISLEWSRIIWSGDLKVVGVCLNFYFQERFNFYRVVQKGKGFLNFCSVKTASRYSIQYPILVLLFAFLALFWGWPTRTRRRLSPSSSLRLQLLAWALSTQDSSPTLRTLPPTLQVHILRWRRVDFNHTINQRHNSRADQLHWLNTWLCGSSSCKRDCGEWSFFICFLESLVRYFSKGGRWYRCHQVEDSLDHCHRCSHLWGHGIPNHSYCLSIVSSSGHPVLCACKGRTPELE